MWICEQARRVSEYHYKMHAQVCIQMFMKTLSTDNSGVGNQNLHWIADLDVQYYWIFSQQCISMKAMHTVHIWKPSLA